MRGEDSHERLMRLLTEHQDALIRQAARGRMPNAEGPGGYWQLSGQVLGLDQAIEIVRSCLFGQPYQDREESPATAYLE